MQENIHTAMLFGFWLVVLSRAWSWEWAIIHVHLLWWPNGETRQSDIYAIYATRDTNILYCVSTRFM